MKTTTVVFTKKVQNINCKNISSIKKDLQALNYSSEGNNNSIYFKICLLHSKYILSFI